MRTIAYNVYGCTGHPEEAAEETWEPAAEGGVVDRTVAALDAEAPDLLTISEAPPRSVVERIAARLEMEVRVFPSRGDWPGALLAEFPIREAAAVADLLDDPPADLFTRHAGRAVVAAGDREVVVYSVHLHPSEEATRRREIERLRELIEADRRSDRPVVVQGDLNHRPDAPEYDAWERVGLVDAYAAGGAGPGATFSAEDPEKRIDYVWHSERMAERLAAVQVLYEPPFGPGTDMASPDGPFLSDHLPVAVEFEEG